MTDEAYTMALHLNKVSYHYRWNFSKQMLNETISN